MDPRIAQLSEAFALPSAGSEPRHAPLLDKSEVERLRELLEIRPPRAHAPMLLGAAGAALVLALAVVAALRELNEWLVYGLAVGALGLLALGMRGATAASRERERAALAELLEMPPWTLARATVADELGEATRVRIVNILNANYPGWTVDLDSADPAWRDLRNATGRIGGGCGGCGSGCR